MMGLTDAVMKQMKSSSGGEDKDSRSSEASADPAANWEAIEALLGPKVLSHHREECAAERKFEEAQLVNIKIDQIRLQAAYATCEMVRDEQVSEYRAVMLKQRQEIDEFQRIWIDKFQEFETRAEESKATFIAQQREDRNKHCEKVAQDIVTHISTKTRDMRLQVDRYAKSRRYEEARQQLTEAEENEQQEKARRITAHQHKIKIEGGAKPHFIDRQKQVKDNFVNRIKLEGLHLAARRKSEMEVMLRRHKIERNKLESKHVKTQQEAQKALQAPGTALARGAVPPKFDFPIRARGANRWT